MLRTAMCFLTVIVLCAAPATAADIKLARHPDYHNGKVVFSYLGDLWLAGEDGSQPRRLTVHRARDVHPRFSPDGKWIAFASNRYGNSDVFIMPADGGKATQLTFHSAGDTVVGWSRDAKKVIFSSARGMLYPGIPNLYEVPVNGGLEQPILTDWGYWGSYAPDGSKLAFNRHPMVWWRKHYRGSYAADLWVLDVQKQSFKRIVDDTLPDEQKANNLWPMYGNGFIYFVSDRDVKAKAGTPEVMKSTNNIWKVNEEGGEPVQVTRHKSGNLFWPSLSSDGKVIVYEQDFELWKLDVAAGTSSRIKIDITTDDQENNLDTLSVNSEADSYHLSPSGKRAVISAHGELFTIATDKGDIRRLTTTPHVRETQPVWSRDGARIAFVSDQGGAEEIWLCDEHGKQLKQLTKGDAKKGQLSWSPDSKFLLYTASDNKLYRYDLDKGTNNVLATGEVASTRGAAFVNPQWSPDGQWISYARADKSLLTQVYLIPAQGGPEKRVSDDRAYSDTLALWTPDGKRLVYLSGLEIGNIGQKISSPVQLYSLALTREDSNPQDKGIDTEADAVKVEKKKPAFGVDPASKGRAKVDVKIDFERIGRRARQLTKTADTISSIAITPDSRSVVFVTSGVEGGRSVQSIWSVPVEGGLPTRVVQSGRSSEEDEGPKGFAGLGGFASLQFAKEGRTLYYRQGKSIYATSLGGGPAAEATSPAAPTAKLGGPAAGSGGRKIAFTARVTVDRRAERRQVFNESWRVMKHYFYDGAMHGVNWTKVREVYEPLLDHVADQDELHNVVNQMLGELNASHTGISGGLGGKETSQASTRFPGFDLEADKSGYYKVKHVYRNGPADKDYVKLNTGDFILGVDDQDLKAGDNYWKTFTSAPGTRLEFAVNSKPGLEGAWKVKIQPVSTLVHTNLQYDKWVDDRRTAVERLTGGDIGYLHIRQMNESSLRQFERDLAKLHTKKALVIDQRFNPGGNIDQELLQILQQRQYQYTRMRGSIEVTRPLQGFFGPMVVLANERSTSDAEVFPDGFRTLKLGKVVGVTTYGAVIGTGAYSLMDGSTIRTPSFGLWNVKGINLENYGVPPDVYVDNAPADFFAGRDAQLEKAAEVLRGEMANRK